MPFRDLEFSGSRNSDGAFFTLKYAGKTLVGKTKTVRAVPVHMAGNVAVIHAARGGRPASISWASSLPARFRAAPAYPALLESRNGFRAFAAQDARGETYLVAAGSPAAALALDPAVAAALPDAIRDYLDAEMAKFRIAMAEEMTGGNHSAGAEAALALLREPGWRCIAGRGETGDACIWTLAGGNGRYAVAGVTRQSATLTILFPFLSPDREYDAEWIDDSLDYYVKGELEIRPATVTARTKAVVKTSGGGGFAALICGRRLASSSHA